MGLGSAILTFVTIGIVKVGVTILGLRILVLLARAVFSKEQSHRRFVIPSDYLPDLKLVWYSLLLFNIAETACWVAIEPVPTSTGTNADLLHSICSGIGMGVFALGMYRYLDKKLLRYGTATCVANRLCRGCTISEPGGCKFRVLILLFVVFVLLGAVFPVCVPLDRIYADPARTALPFSSLNDWYDKVVTPFLRAWFSGIQLDGSSYFIPESINFIEYRLIPGAALIVLLISLYQVVTSQVTKALNALILGVGLLAYSYTQIVLFRGTNDLLLGSLGHETAELWFLITLEVFFRRDFPPQSAVVADS